MNPNRVYYRVENAMDEVNKANHACLKALFHLSVAEASYTGGVTGEWKRQVQETHVALSNLQAQMMAATHQMILDQGA